MGPGKFGYLSPLGHEVASDAVETPCTRMLVSAPSFGFEMALNATEFLLSKKDISDFQVTMWCRSKACRNSAAPLSLPLLEGAGPSHES